MTIQTMLLDSLTSYTNNNVLHFNNKYYTYGNLYVSAVSISNTLLNINYEKQSIIVMGMKSFYTHAAICGIIISGSYYTPLNEIFPVNRNIEIVKQSGAKIIILDYKDFNLYEDILSRLENYHIICPEEHIEFLSNKFKNHKFYSNAESKEIIKVDGNDTCYMLFTSGSTGTPKGIKIAHKNVENYINAFRKRHNILSEHRFMQMNDLTFDISIHSILLSFSSGACLYIPDKITKLSPVKYINQYNITHLFIVPSLIRMMDKIRLLKDNNMPTLQYVAIAGETLLFSNAILFARSCPSAKLENLYGPTEAAIACTYFEFNKDTEELDEYCGSMPIGKANDGMEVFLVDDKLNIINNKRTGQLVLSGNQLAKGYINNIEQTKEKFIKINDKDCYLTGDLCRLVNGELVFLGRNDSQVQILGYRVEIYEIENVVSKVSEVTSNAVIPSPTNGITYEYLTLFVTLSEEKEGWEVRIKDNISRTLPEYMIPKKYILLENMPLNSNGKIDRNILKTMIK